MADTYNIVDDEDSVQVIEGGTGLTVTISEDSIGVSEPTDSINVDSVEDSVSVVDSDTSLSVTDGDDAITPEFNEIHQNVTLNNTYNVVKSAIVGIAGTDINAHRMVAADDGFVVYADKDDPDHIHIVAGLTDTAFLQSADVLAIMNGDIQEVTWTWTLNKPIFLGNNGFMTQTVPTTGFLLQVGYPVTTDKMIVDIKTPINLG